MNTNPSVTITSLIGAIAAALMSVTLFTPLDTDRPESTEPLITDAQIKPSRKPCPECDASAIATGDGSVRRCQVCGSEFLNGD